MKKYGRDNRPYVKPVTRIELNESNTRLRWILAVVLLCIAVVAIAIGLMSALDVEPGWQTVTVSSDQPNCSGDFTLLYDFRDSGGGAAAQLRQLTNLYTQATEEAYRTFTPDLLEEGLHNIAYLNAHINETVTVEEALYQALTLVKAYGDRHVFLAPAMVEYNRVFRSESDAEAALYDPAGNAETARYLQELAQFAGDPAQISLELQENCQVQLKVSPEYLAFAEENGIEVFLDFGWMTNAFIADYLAEVLTGSGYTKGYLASFDGFTRNLDGRGEEYTFNVFHREGMDIYLPARMHYAQPTSIVFLRDYPMVEKDKWRYYGFASGEIVTSLLDPVDCRSKSALGELVSYSTETGCAEILVQTAPVFIADDFAAEALKTLAESNVYSIWCEGTVIKYNDADLQLELLTEEAGSHYSAELVK